RVKAEYLFLYTVTSSLKRFIMIFYWIPVCSFFFIAGASNLKNASVTFDRQTG
ncbi:hypothetical protein X975_04972, partial [Stegodyphus mimosarum]